MRNALSSALIALLMTPVFADEGRPACSQDRTGTQWVLPFSAALAKAKKENRPLLIKAIAFGTSPDGGW